jgi:IS30 family transposase
VQTRKLGIESPPSEKMPALRKRSLARLGSKKAQGGLVTRADLLCWLKREYPEDEAMYISHETIYRTLFVQARGALKRELLAHLRSRRLMRRSRRASTKGQPRGQIKEAVSIRERPPEVEDRAVPGHWEGDLLAGSRNTHVATLVERSSRFVLLWCRDWQQGHRERRRGSQ